MKTPVVHYLRIIVVICLVLNTAACARLGSRGDPRDPFEGFNRSVYSFNEAVDKTLMNRIAHLYQTITPDFLDQGISNFFSNVNDVVVIVNDFLQVKISQAVSDIARVVFNSSLGIGGLFDVSTGMGFPKHNEDFGQTLAKWGFGSGPYLVIPFLGPSDVRDGVGYLVTTTYVSPFAYINDTETYAGLMTLNYVDFKADLLSAQKLIGETAIDKYAFTKNAFFELRDNLINDRKASELEGLEDLDLNNGTNPNNAPGNGDKGTGQVPATGAHD